MTGKTRRQELIASSNACSRPPVGFTAGDHSWYRNALEPRRAADLRLVCDWPKCGPDRQSEVV